MSLIGSLILVCVAVYAFTFIYVDREKVQASLARVEAYTAYELMQDGKVVLKFDQDTIFGTGCFVNRYDFAPSCQGRMIVNVDETIWHNKYKKVDPYQLLEAKADSLDSVYEDSKWRISELNYYLHSHNVTDEGYHMISQYAQRETIIRNHTKKMLDSLNHIKKGKHLKIVYRQEFAVFYPETPQGKKSTILRDTLEHVKGQCFQLCSHKTPENAKALLRSQATSIISLNIRPLYKMPPLYFHIDSVSTYIGQVDSVGQPHGHGAWRNGKGTYYEGRWNHGKRNGFGFSIAPKKQLRAGEWKNDSYKGERLVYTSDRIYGIDISKYQHVIGKKKYSIDWKRLRITHLGNISKKTISGNVNFPIRFIYVKSTEGGTLLNPYYRQDYLAARKHGFKVGSYHFFSTLSPAATQARQFLRHTFVKKGDFPPVLDVEPTHEQIQKMGGTGVLFARVRSWLRIVERATGKKPILYISQTFVNRYLNQAPDLKHNYQIWIARYGEYKPDIRLVYWQLCPDGRVAGIHGAVDINVFNGYSDAYDRFVKESTI